MKTEKKVPTIFPVYLLKLEEQWRIVFPNDRADIGHMDYWEQTISHIVAQHYGIPQKKLANLPYCQRRARIVDNKVYYGEKPDAELLNLLRKAVGNDQLVFVYEDHEKRLREDVLEFRRLIGRYSRHR